MLSVVGQSRRLLLGEDGFARVDSEDSGLPPPNGITVSSWVNITEFPGGVAPLVTIISADATYQIAFFVRHDGAGVLWGGPATAPQNQDDSVDRQPRSRVHTRRRRDTVDYSMGLGDVMNIMGPRKERSNTWTPMNFVDVSEMGVADLETSGSSTSNHYDNWYDVGYELQMQESANPEPKILTKPTGENDFVVINWEGHNAPPLSTNQWDPVNDDLSTPDFAAPQVATKVRAPDHEKFVWSQEENKNDGGWSSQVFPTNTDAETSSDAADVTNISPESAYSKQKPPKSETRTRPARPFVPDLRRPTIGDKTRRPLADKFRYNQQRRQPDTITTTTTTSPITTTTIRPIPLSKNTEERVPLWARLKNTASEEKTIDEEITTMETTTRVRPTGPSFVEIPTEKRLTMSEQTTTAPRIVTRLPVTSTRSPEVIATIKGTTTSKPASTKPKLNQTFRITTPSKERKTYTSNNNSNWPKRPFTPLKNTNMPLHSHNLDEFKRVLEGKPAIEDNGNKVVVYSMPITDVDAFNRMYEHYQEMESRHNTRINLHAVYEQAREGSEVPSINEEESNQNRIEQIPEPLPILTYKEEPLHFANSDIAPIIDSTPIIIETVIEEDVPEQVYDQSSFHPVNFENPYKTLESDYSAYYPYVQKAEPIIITPTSEGGLRGLQNIPPAYEPAIIDQQDISGKQAGFYQEPSRISHEQLPPEYTRKSQNENKKISNFRQSNEFETHDHRPVQNANPIQEDTFNSNIPIEKTYASPELISQQMLTQAISQSLNTERVESETTQNVDFNGNNAEEDYQETNPIRIEAIPLENVNTPEVPKEVPLNVNFRKMPYNFDPNTWYHITFSWNSNDHVLRIYVNGLLAGVLEQTIEDKTVLPTNGMMLLGKTLLPSLTGFDPTSHLTGEMSNFVVWGETLTATEVHSVFTCEQSPVHPVLLAWNTTPLRVYNDASVQQAPPICGISSEL